ncbi:MAG: MBL fold metallo-hydrolase [Acidobacteriota bacterium]
MAEPTQRLELLCLGVGKGATHVLRGEPSTAFAVLDGGRPRLLVDCGAGVLRSCRELLDGAVPRDVYLTHNHMDHTGDLPVAVQVLSALGLPPRLLGHADVLDIVRRHRLHELPPSRIDGVEWIEADADGALHLGGRLGLRLHRSVHSYLCYGFELLCDGWVLAAYSGDSAYDPGVHGRVARAPVAVVDGRPAGNHDHASFDELDTLAARHPDCTFLVVHYEHSDHVFASANIRLWRTGERVLLPRAA